MKNYQILKISFTCKGITTCIFIKLLTHLAKETQFVQRTSKFKAQDLAALCIGMGQDIASYSLTRLCGVLESETGVLISPEGLNVRLNEKQ